jgi:hypothetical protein
MTRTVVLGVLSAWVGFSEPTRLGADAVADPLAFFDGCFVPSESERRRIAAGETVARTLDASGRDVSVLMIRRTSADADRLVAWMRAIDQFKSGPLVRAVGRFSSPPTVADVERIALEDDELHALRDCRAGDCGLKLTASEIETIRREVRASGPAWKARTQDVFRSFVLARVERYLAGGHSAIGRWADRDDAPSLAEAFAGIADRSPCAMREMPALMTYLVQYPRAASAATESFIYWSQERLNGRPVLSVTHVAILRGAGGPDNVIVAGKQIFATHYMNGSLNLTAIVGGGDEPRYLVALNRTTVDLLGGFFGGLARILVERRLRSEAGTLMDALGRRVESAPPR